MEIAIEEWQESDPVTAKLDELADEFDGQVGGEAGRTGYRSF